MSSKSCKDNDRILEELKLAIKSSRQHYGRNEMSEAKRIALKARDKALAGGLHLDAKLLEAQALVCDKKWDEVISLLSDIVQNDFYMLGFAWDRLGIAYDGKKKYDKAIDCYQRALDTPGYDTPGATLNNMGNAYDSKKEYDKAIEYYQKALNTPGYDTPGIVLYNMGAAYDGKKEYDKAIECCQRALDTPDYDTPGAALNNMGVAYANKKEYDKAIECYQRTLGTPGYDTPSNALYNMGVAYAGKKEYDKAIECYQRALGTPGYYTPGKALNNMGNIYANKKEYDKAIEYYQKALDIPGYNTPGNALNNMGNIYANKKDYDKAIEYYQKALDIPGYDTPGNALNNIGLAYAGKKEYEKAIASMERATQEFKRINDADGINTAKEFIDLWKRTDRAAKKGLIKVAQEFDDVASALATSSKQGVDVASDNSFRRLIKRAGARTTASADYARQPESVKNDMLVVLKGWSSSIPIIAKVNAEAFGGQLCRGGGYFIKAAKHGIALDPGYDYLRNLWNNGYHIKEINTVIVTHNHPDHQDDLCRIAGLDHEYRINVTGSPDKSKIRYYLDQDTERAYEATLVSLDADPTMIKQVDVDNSECRINTGVSLDIYKTKHGDGHVVRAPFGAVLKLKLQDGTDCRIGYTSDTAYFDDLSSNLKDCDIMICHFSSASTDEFNNPEKLHQSHLGFNGLIKLIKNTNAKLYIVSEFWGGVGDQRYDLVEYLKNDFASKGRDIKIIAGDIGLTIDLKTLDIYCKACEKPTPFHDIRTIEPSTPYDGLRYFCKECPTSLPWKKE